MLYRVVALLDLRAFALPCLVRNFVPLLSFVATLHTGTSYVPVFFFVYSRSMPVAALERWHIHASFARFRFAILCVSVFLFSIAAAAVDAKPEQILILLLRCCLVGLLLCRFVTM